MYTATWIAQKGGTRNPPLAINFPFVGEALGLRTALVDLDPPASVAEQGGHSESACPAVAPEIESALHREETWADR